MIKTSPKTKSFISIGIFIVIPLIWITSLLILGKIVNSNFGKKFNEISDFSVYIIWMRSYMNPESLQKILYASLIFLTICTLIFLKQKRLVDNYVKFKELERKHFSKKQIVLYLVSSFVVIMVNIWDWAYKLRDGIWVNQFHSNYVLNASNDLVNGKTLLVDTFSVYGSGFIHLITFIM